MESPGGFRNNFGVTGVGLNDLIQDHSTSPVSAAATMAVVSTFHTIEFKVDCTTPGSNILEANYQKTTEFTSQTFHC